MYYIIKFKEKKFFYELIFLNYILKLILEYLIHISRHKKKKMV